MGGGYAKVNVEHTLSTLRNPMEGFPFILSEGRQRSPLYPLQALAPPRPKAFHNYGLVPSYPKVSHKYGLVPPHPKAFHESENSSLLGVGQATPAPPVKMKNRLARHLSVFVFGGKTSPPRSR